MGGTICRQAGGNMQHVQHQAAPQPPHSASTESCPLRILPPEWQHVFWNPWDGPFCFQMVMDPHEASPLISIVFLPNSFFPWPNFLSQGLSSVHKGQLSMVVWPYPSVHLPIQPHILIGKYGRSTGTENNAGPYFWDIEKQREILNILPTMWIVLKSVSI